MGNQTKKPTTSKMFNKIAAVAALALSVEAQRQPRSRNSRAPFDDDTPYHMGNCVLRDGSAKIGRISIYQEGDTSAVRPISMDARIRGLDYDRVSIDFFKEDPTITGNQNSLKGTYGVFRPNFRDSV